MNTSPKILVLLLVCSLLLPQAVLAQQGAATLENLRAQVARLEAIDRDPATTHEVRELNSPFLAQRRAELRDLLGKRVKALESYLSAASSALSPEEAESLRETVDTLRRELASLEGGGHADASLAESSPAPAEVAPVEVASLKLPALPPPQPLRASSSVDTAVPQPANAAAFTGSLMAMPQPATTAPTCEPVSDSDEVTYTVNKKFGDASYESYFEPNGTVKAAEIDNVIAATLYPPGTHAENDDYAIVHVIKWEKIEKKYEALRDRWALYKYSAKEPGAGKTHWQKQTAFKGTRIYGRERVHVLIVHFIPSTDTETGLNRWDIKYTVSVKKKQPANVANALALLGAITTPAGALAGGNATKVQAVWGGGLMCIKDVPSDIVADAEVIPRDFNSGQPVQSPKTYSKTYDNEGRYWWDVSVGVPLKEIKEVQYDASEGVVRAKEVNRQNAYGFLNLFFRSVDVKEENFLKVPHLVLGVPISKKPLDRPIVGLGYGIRKFDIKFDFYAGAVFNRVREPRSLGVGESATPGELESDLRTKRVTKFVFGVNFPLKQVKDAISK